MAEITLTLHAWMFPAAITIFGLPIAHLWCRLMGDFEGNFPGLMFAFCIPAWGLASLCAWIAWGLA